ncbi:metal-dependent hydrolase [Haladaptatus pallidirubidus]|uniref:Metal-dependent hydrolase n=1 Tax=Haladaptatus pallidirubidus TaxID=1008152 RepID=A0AAV3UM28_9EURY|nr:metal-dependent hydrolase [Haladaptatus pallidirubidus]
MMATTHALIGVLLASITLLVAPEFAPVAVFAGFFGGLFPDFDLYSGHRKTLHFPVYFSVAGLVAVAIAVVVPTGWTVAVAVFLLSAAIHSVSDAFGGGLELKPWLGESERAVYDHFHGRWISPRRWIRYDGAPEDFALGVFAALPSLVLYDGTIQTLVIAAVLVSGIYALLRKQMVIAAEWLVGRIPASMLAYIPDRFVRDFV